MFIPANFAIGALVGAAASYVYKDESAREALSGLGSKVKDGLGSTLTMLKKKPEEVEEVTEEVVEEVADTASDVEEVVAEQVEAASDSKSDKA